MKPKPPPLPSLLDLVRELETALALVRGVPPGHGQCPRPGLLGTVGELEAVLAFERALATVRARQAELEDAPETLRATLRARLAQVGRGLLALAGEAQK